MNTSSSTRAINPKVKTPIAVAEAHSTKKNTRQYHIIIGLFFYTLLLAAWTIEWQWPALVELQQDNIYKQITGFLLMTFILMQWKLYLARRKINPARAIHALKIHQWQGAMTPVFFYVHSSSLGYGFQMVLSLALLITTLSGLLSPSTTKIRNRRYLFSWLILHVSGACIALILLFYHLFISYTYS